MLVVLGIFALIDMTFSAFRESSGRNFLINKRDYYKTAMVRGALLATASLLILALLFTFLLLKTPNSDDLIAQADLLSAHMLYWYVPFSFLMIVGIFLRLILSVDYRSLLSVTLFGPLTFVRPFLILSGFFQSSLHCRSIEILILTAASVALVLAFPCIVSVWREKYVTLGAAPK